MATVMSFLRRPAVLFLLAVGLVLIGTASAVYLSGPGTVTSQVPSRFTINGKTFAFTYIATTEAERESGLMNKKVTNITFMLFVFPSPGTYQFWMYDTNTSLDMIWVSVNGTQGRIVQIVQGAQPCYDQLTCPHYGPSTPASYVIEAKAGFAQAEEIAPGDQVQFS